MKRCSAILIVLGVMLTGRGALAGAASQVEKAAVAPLEERQPGTLAFSEFFEPGVGIATATMSVGEVQQENQDDTIPISLFLDNADIHQVIRIIGEALGLNYIVDPSVAGTVNINTSGTLQRSDLLPILETILRINGATIVQTGNFYQIVPATAALRQSLSVQDGVAEPTLSDDQFVIQVVRMKFVAAEEISGLLTPYLSEGANIVVHASGNILLVSERRRNLQKLLEIIDVFDSNVFEGDRVRLFPIEHNLAADMVEDLETIFSGFALSQGGGAIRFVAIERLNSILVFSGNSAVFPEVESWLARLDLPLTTAGIRNFVYKVQNTRATHIERVLAQLYGQEVQLSSIYQAPAGASPTGQQPAEIGTQAAVPSTAFVPTGNIRIIADEINNSLVVQATPQEYAVIEETIRELDVLPRQVLIDAQIYEVLLDDSLSLGISATLQNRGTLQNPQTTASMGVGGVGFAGQTFAFIGRARELVAFVSATENRSRVRTLSAPSVLVSDNQTALFQVGAEVPVPTSSAASAAQVDGSTVFAQTIQFRPTGVILSVRPQINDSGNVTLEIDQEVSQATVNTTSALAAPVIGKAAISSTVVIRDGQTIALGGFIRESNESSHSRIPILGRIPGLGALFGSTSRSTSRTELIILITPHVIRSHDDTDLATDELKDKLQELKKVLINTPDERQ